MSNKKTLKETSTVSGIVGTAAVYKDQRNPKGKNTKKKAYTTAKLKEREEQKLREAIRHLIFLNKVKYHEEQVKKELQEQKLRKVIRFLLKEGDNTRDINFNTTGAASAWTFIQNIERTTFENDFANTLKTSKEQRDSFKTVYLTGIKIYLDSLDQQYMILNPDDVPGQGATAASGTPAQTPSADQTTPDMNSGALPAKRRDISEQGEQVHPSAAQATPSPNSPTDTKYIQSAAVKGALSSTQATPLDKTGRSSAEDALKRDLPQIDPLYFNLTFKQVTTNSGRNTNDRQEFRFFLIGDQNKVGNLQLKFKEWNDKVPLGGQDASENIPKMEPDPLNLPDISSGGTAGDTSGLGATGSTSPTPSPATGATGGLPGL